MLANRLVVNENKSNFIIFKTQQSNAVSQNGLTLNHKNVNLTTCTRFLGIIIDESLTWTSHVNELAKKLNSITYAMRVLSKYIDTGVMKTVYYANFYSHIRFGILNWGRSTEVNRIFVIQKRVVRIMFNLKWNASCRGVFKANNLLTVTAVYILEGLLFLFRNKSKFECFKVNHSYATRTLNYSYPIHNLTKVEKGPSYSAIKFFNKIPNNLKTIDSYKSFKICITEYLISIEPYSISEFFDYV